MQIASVVITVYTVASTIDCSPGLDHTHCTRKPHVSRQHRTRQTEAAVERHTTTRIPGSGSSPKAAYPRSDGPRRSGCSTAPVVDACTSLSAISPGRHAVANLRVKPCAFLTFLRARASKADLA
ncbi:hypothetical protein PLICRDRAFT_548442 [Plicaturopsis crispa FD-325 SS-3]|nr:hypothetical protein PLICRDRAFT_548442 [Plicaturopsis crispa FD-325 SS-3]